eukprot:scaffold1001_cov169-Amphora_coffeaeformis.AAC.22
MDNSSVPWSWPPGEKRMRRPQRMMMWLGVSVVVVLLLVCTFDWLECGQMVSTKSQGETHDQLLQPSFSSQRRDVSTTIWYHTPMYFSEPSDNPHLTIAKLDHIRNSHLQVSN